MSTLSKITNDKKMTSLKNPMTMPFKTDKNISSSMKLQIITNPIKSDRVSKNFLNNLSISSVVKAGLVFLGTSW